MKICTKCQKRKYAKSFYKSKKGKDGLNHVCKICDDQRRRQHMLNNLEAHHQANKRRQLRYRFGMPYDKYQTLLAAQNHVCAICQQPETRVWKGVIRALAVDHCHKTGKIRGLLCGSCNTALGLLKDDEKLVGAAFAYLKNNS